MTSPAAPDTVYVLGAGFSKACFDQMPLTNALGTAVARRIGEPPGAGGLGVEVLGQTRARGFESYLSDLGERHPHQSDAEWFRAQSLLNQLLPLIADEVITVQRAIASGGLSPWWLRTLLELCSQAQSGIITFNYDTLVEAHWPRNWNPARNTLGAHPSEMPTRFVTDGGDFAWSDPGSASTGLFKLHGSVNWLASPMDQHGATLRIESHDLALKGLLGDEGQRASGALAPVIVPPTSVKHLALQRSFISTLWKQARRRLERAERVVLVGYSLPETDRSAAALLRDGMGRNRPELVIVDKTACDVLERLKRMEISYGSTRLYEGEGAVEAFVTDELRAAEARVALPPKDTTEFGSDNVAPLIVSPVLPDGTLRLRSQRGIEALCASRDGEDIVKYADLWVDEPQPSRWTIEWDEVPGTRLPVLDVHLRRTDEGRPSTMTLLCGSPVPIGATRPT